MAIISTSHFRKCIEEFGLNLVVKGFTKPQNNFTHLMTTMDKHGCATYWYAVGNIPKSFEKVLQELQGGR